MRRLYFLLILALTLTLVFTSVTFGAEDQAAVRALLFYSPTCPHCHTVINEVLPPLHEQYGDQLRIALIDVTSESGRNLYYAAVNELPILENQRGVPALVVGETLLIGSYDIPAQLPGIIETGLAEGGIDWPAITGVEAVSARIDAEFETVSTEAGNSTVADEQGTQESVATNEQPEQAAAPPEGAVNEAVQDPVLADAEPPVIVEPEAETVPLEEGAVVLAGEDTTIAQAGIMDLFKLDPVAGVVALLVFLMMIATAVVVIVSWIRHGLTTEAASGWRLWVLPVLSVVGLLVAGYLAFVETTETAAVCGPVGDCNAVQQSSYARLFGILPIGVLGIVGYLAFLLLWVWQRYGPVARTQGTAWLLPAVALIGVVFSIYLTALELFVIVAVCMWCITSAILMTLMLWTTFRWQIPPAVQPATRSRRKHRHAPR